MVHPVQLNSRTTHYWGCVLVQVNNKHKEECAGTRLIQQRYCYDVQVVKGAIQRVVCATSKLPCDHGPPLQHSPIQEIIHFVVWVLVVHMWSSFWHNPLQMLNHNTCCTSL